MKSNWGFVKILFFVCLIILNNYEAVGDQKCNNKKIIIIGAGAAGIAASSKLFENGFTNITILEAENRIGGRLHTTKFGNYCVDLGGQWVHGQKDNAAFNLAYPLGLLDTNNVTDFDQILFDSSGNILNDTINQYIMEFIGKYYLEDVPHKDTASDQSYGEFAERIFEKEFKNVPEIYKNKKRFLHYFEILALSADSGDTWYDLAIRDDKGFVDREGDQQVNWKTRGFATILDVLMKRYPDPEKEFPVINNTILNCEVTSIDYSESGNGQLVTVNTKNGQVYKADHVIVTVSLGVLKEKHKSLFTPALPDKKVSAIEGLGFGTAGKVYLLFDKPFWQHDEKKPMHYGFIWNDEDIEAIEKDPERKWTLGVLGAFTVEHKPNLLEFYIASRYAKAMEVVPEEKVFNHSVQLLERFMGKTHTIPKPLAIMRTQWYNNPHFRGAYSYRDVVSDKQNIYPSMLEEPILSENLKILFAGEATSPHRFSTADGAIESGWTAANRLINYYKS